MKEHLFIFYPGGFKPVHDGHIAMIEQLAMKYPNYDTKVFVVMGNSMRDGITAESSLFILEKLSNKFPNVNILSSNSRSPIYDVYNLTGTKEFGNGYYALASSEKGTDLKRSLVFFEKFSLNGEYYTEGVIPLLLREHIFPIMFEDRIDEFNNMPISSRILRMDIVNNDYESFKTGYKYALSMGILTEDELKSYFLTLKQEMSRILVMESLKNVLNEGGAAGHMMHPYEVSDFTFNDLFELIEKLLSTDITDATEKLDGQNLFASVDENGKTIFARNASHIRSIPWTMEDIEGNKNWKNKPSVLNAFSNGAKTIDAVFKNIPNKVKFFNTDDKKHGVRIRKWVNFEILDPNNRNVIPYIDSKISIHSISLATSYYDNFGESQNGGFSIEMSNDINDFKVLSAAISKTQNTVFKSQITPTVIIHKAVNDSELCEKYKAELQELMDTYELTYSNTLSEYFTKAIFSFMQNNRSFLKLPDQVKDFLSERWSGKRGYNISYIKHIVTPEEYDIIKTFEKEKLDDLKKKVVRPLDVIFMKLGNNVIKRTEGLANAGKESDIVKQLNGEVRKLIDTVSSENNEKDKDKLERLLIRLNNIGNELNATEGVVIKFKGQVIKLTGSFAPLNAILGISKYKKSS